MKQIELFEDLVPIQQYLHIWTEAERAARVKNPTPEAQGESPASRTEERVRQEVTQLPHTRQVATRVE